MKRIGPHMRRILYYVAGHEGCSILACRVVSTAKGGHQWTYKAAHRCLNAGLIRHVPGGRRDRYRLEITDAGRAALT